jgi:negative regulator of flagellin synthesis FlgM
MRIDLFNSAPTHIGGEVNSNVAKTGNAPALDAESSGDRATLTTGSTAVSSLVSEAMNTPAIRQGKVESLRQAVSSGQYQLDPHLIAGAMIDEHA